MVHAPTASAQSLQTTQSVDQAEQLDMAAHALSDPWRYTKPFHKTSWGAAGLEAVSLRQVTLDHGRRLSIRQYTPLPPPESSPASPLEAWQDVRPDIAYQRDWHSAYGDTPHGLEVALTPRTEARYTPDGASAGIGATLKIGQNLRDLAQDGDTAFGERPRWYLFAAGSKRAVGYNLARGRDGALSRAGISHDRGSSFGDATVGVAYRQGPLETSLGVVFRENETKGLRNFEGLKTDVDESILAFSFTLRPR